MKKWMFIGWVVCAAFVCADQIQLQDGSILKGEISSLNDTVLELKTSFAGAIKIDRALVADFSTEEPVFVRLTDGTVASKTTAPVAEVKHAWIDPDDDPEVLAQEALKRSWIYQAALNANGSSGNTEKSNVGVDISAIMSGPDDELRLYMLYSGGETEGVKTSDEIKGGVRYANYLNGSPWGLYVREELEKDEFENIKLRSVSAGGLSIRFANKDHFKLSGNAGISYRSERYEDGSPDLDEIGLDFGIQHFYLWANHLKMNNEISYVPSLAEPANYLISQNSSLDFPVPGSDLFKVRLGLRNDYNSQPAVGREKLDTTYYTSLVADWN